ncbi:MAG: site-2 protease family protein [Helicobacteraceae bacterium]
MQSFDPLIFIIQILAFGVAIIGHEIMHGYAAFRYGDNTAKLAGRLTINPVKHVDLVGSVIIPGILFVLQAPFLFGWAKPVPVDARVVFASGGYIALMVVSLAGVAYNFGLFMLGAFFYDASAPVILQNIIGFLIIYNLVLGVINILPIPPLDGANAAMYLATYLKLDFIITFYEKIWNYGLFILIAFLFLPQTSGLLFGVINNLLRVFV